MCRNHLRYIYTACFVLTAYSVRVRCAQYIISLCVFANHPEHRTVCIPIGYNLPTTWRTRLCHHLGYGHRNIHHHYNARVIDGSKTLRVGIVFHQIICCIWATSVQIVGHIVRLRFPLNGSQPSCIYEESNYFKTHEATWSCERMFCNSGSALYVYCNAQFM